MYREIIVKSLIKKGKINLHLEKEIILEEHVSQTLGCWIIALENEIENLNNEIFLKGNFSLQLWYATNNNQKSNVYQEKISFYEKVNMKEIDHCLLNEELFTKVFVLNYPTCTQMNLQDGKIFLVIEGNFDVSCYQEKELVVSCLESKMNTFDLDEEISLNVNPNYIEGKMNNSNL
jgi:spore coat protein E